MATLKQVVSTVTLSLDEILQGNCINILSPLPEKSIDLIGEDQLYNLQLQRGRRHL